VCTINVAGFDEGDTKLELILQFIQHEGIDVMVSTDAQLHAKRKHWYGQIAKRRLGIGKRTNVNPCILDYGTGATGSFKRVSFIFTIWWDFKRISSDLTGGTLPSLEPTGPIATGESTLVIKLYGNV